MALTPNAEEQLILIAAGTLARRDREAERAQRLAAGVDWGQLHSTLRRRRLLTTLGPRLVELSSPSEEFQNAVEEALAAARRHGASLQLVSLHTIAALADAGVRSSALKGPLLGEALYGDPGRRPSNDIDLLVPPDSMHAAVNAVRGLGYREPSDYVFRDGLPLLHFVLEHERQQLPPIELHWRIHWYEDRFADERLLPATVDRTGSWRPEAVDELAALLLFYARDGFVDLRLASDVGAWWDGRGGELKTGALGELMLAYPSLARALTVSSRVAEKLVGLPVDQLVGDRARLGARGQAALRLANPHRRSSRAQIYADIGLVDGLLMPRGGLVPFLRRNVFPPREVLDQQARHGARRRARSRVSRSLGVLGRYCLGLTRALRTREASG